MCTSPLKKRKANEVRKSDRLSLAYGRCLSRHGGFLPPIIVPTIVPEPFDRYTTVLNEVPNRYTQAGGGVRPWLDRELKHFDDRLVSQMVDMPYWHQHKLMSQLAILAHVYRWNYVPPAPEIYNITHCNLPLGIKRPFALLANHLQQPKCGSMWLTKYCNWTLKGKSDYELYQNVELTRENLQIVHNWLPAPMDKQLEQWISILILSEARGALVIEDLVSLIQIAEQKDVDAAIVKFDVLLKHLQEMTRVFNIEVIHRKLDKNYWREWVQPTFVWGLEENGERLEGASGLQIGALQVIDIALNVQGGSVMVKAAVSSRKYFPVEQRYFIDVLEAYRPKLRAFVLDSNVPDLMALYDACLSIITQFRKSHKARGAAYMAGDGSEKKLTTTGLSIEDNSKPVEIFKEDMEGRIKETSDARLTKSIATNNEHNP